MCAIFGAVLWDANVSRVDIATRVLNLIVGESFERGRDGRGFHSRIHGLAPKGFNYDFRSVQRATSWSGPQDFFGESPVMSASVIGNMRAEPTTEFVSDKWEHDQQPYRVRGWNIVHNGTIANDKELRTFDLATMIDSAAIAEVLGEREFFRNTADAEGHFLATVKRLKGSYAILATHDDFPDTIFAACNYRPIWFAKDTNSIFFASSRSYFPERLTPEMVSPYSVHAFGRAYTGGKKRLDVPESPATKALVVCSGGMDSVVAATWAVSQGFGVELVHFRYGSRAEGPEVEAVRAIADNLKVDVVFKTIPVYDSSDSPLLQADSTIAGGEEGSEFAHEWVPARNLVMLAFATAYAEAKGFNVLILGNNLEEAGAYPDNEPEFINRFNDLLPFAIGDGKRLEVLMPVGNLMKHEIVALGLALGAPLHLTWSCYRAGEKHCGTCGPCYMRRKAFSINNAPEVIEYEKGN